MNRKNTQFKHRLYSDSISNLRLTKKSILLQNRILLNECVEL